ncbi:MAG: glycosyltransferase family 1 protein [Mitsuokella sp.]|uniref:glycosyltransferase family 1 protein n=1 Tax=Mitsuokella sp. TaxID=2049034 RepID=UPI003EFE92EB
MRVLQATVANDKGGLTGYILNNYRRIDKSKFQFDFITYDDHLDFQDEVTSLGGKIYKFPHPTKFYQYYKKLKDIRDENGYKIIHFHMSYANIVPIVAAKLAGFPRIIIHSHSTGLDTPSYLVRQVKICLHKLGKHLLPLLATDYLACSELAAQWMYPHGLLKKKKHRVMYNAIDLARFRFDSTVRQQTRSKLGIPDDCYVVGHVGRFTYQKNHEFLIDVFDQVCRLNPKSLLLLIGDGPDRPQIEEKVKTLNLSDKVKFLGQQADISSFYQAMDVMVLPSRFEGLCIVAIEAQMAGLPCVCSEALPQETKVSCDFTYKPLSDSAESWAECVLEKKGVVRKDQTEALRRAGYDSYAEIKRIERLYT